ncbi:hypothetical protein [Labrys neptuniae]
MASHFDGRLIDSLPVLEPGLLAAEGSAANLPDPPNTGLFDLIGGPAQSASPIHMTYTWNTELDKPQQWVAEHYHDYDEILIWTGSDPQNPRDLGAEMYLEIEGEGRTITTSGSIFIPAGVKHCPLWINRCWRPFTFSALSLAPIYKAKL